LNGGDGSDFLAGGVGNDIQIGGSGNDVFFYRAGDGADRIEDFEAGAGDGDQIAFGDASSLPGSLGDVQAAASQAGANVVLDFGEGENLTLVGVNVASLNADDFIFSG
jgi:Ca2+-binding RTX toxin-like protein